MTNDRDDLLIEIGQEEIPARMQEAARNALKNSLEALLKDHGLPAASVEVFSTPRRIALHAANIPLKSADQKIEKKGPATTAPEQAINGFLKSNGLNSVDQLEIRPANKGAVYWAVFEKAGAPARSLLPAIIAQLIQTHHWSKSMRFGDQALRWVRPLTHIMAIFGDKGIEGSIDLGGESSARLEFIDHSFGHFILSPDPFKPKDFMDYKAALLSYNVVIDHHARKAKISADLPEYTAEDPALLAEVTGLVESPKLLIGAIDDEFMAMPPRILQLTMRVHQKYFTLLDQDGAIIPKFAMVANRKDETASKGIIAGNERVLRARLHDAKFFYHQDIDTGLNALSTKLEKTIFHAKLGSIAQRVTRIQALAKIIVRNWIGETNLKPISDAALLCKADLASNIVGEFPELQGDMGGHYAKLAGYDHAVGDAIAQHYQPQGPHDSLPHAPLAVTLALADKIDMLAGFWLIDELPTGSKDPFALRRACLGIIRLVLENQEILQPFILSQNLRKLFEFALQTYQHDGVMPQADLAPIIDRLMVFFKERLTHHYKSQDFAHDQIMAVLARFDGNILLSHHQLSALQSFMESGDSSVLIQLYKRAANIFVTESAKTPALNFGIPENADHDYHSAALPLKKFTLHMKHKREGAGTKPNLTSQQDFLGHYQQLLDYKAPLSDFFDNVLVNDPDLEKRRVNLAILYFVKENFEALLDFSKLS
ncbi:MAG: glycine--tRNA ligase subunit beta [Alphaproteobacteria bacterium]